MDALRRFEPYARWLAHRYRLYGRVAGDEQDVMQEAMIAAWKALGIYRAEHGGSLEGFVKQRMKYRVIECVRRRGKEADVHPGSPERGRADRDAVSIEEWDAAGDDQTLGTVLARERLAIAAGAIRELPRWQRERLVGHLNGLSRREMSSEGSVGVVDQALFRARRRLKAALTT